MKTDTERKFTTLEGSTPNGRRFVIRSYYDPTDSRVYSRVLEWLPNGEVGSVSVPMRTECWTGQLYYELTRLGAATDETRENCFAI